MVVKIIYNEAIGIRLVNKERMFYLFDFKFRKLVILSLVFVMVFSFAACAKNKEGLVGEVNGIPITQEEFDTDYLVFKNLYERQLGEDALNEVGADGKTLNESLKESILEKLIMEKIITKDSENMNMTVTDEEISSKLDEYVNSVGGEEKFEEFLTNNDITREFFNLNIKKEILVEKHKISYVEGIEITDKDAEKYYNDNVDNMVILRASHILVDNEEDGKKILERIQSGEDFATLATLESLDSVSAAQGGDLGYFGKGNMITEFEDAVFAMEEGEVSSLVKTEAGYHIIYLEERRDTFEELKEDIIKNLKDQEYLKAVEKLRSSAKVSKYLDTSK